MSVMPVTNSLALHCHFHSSGLGTEHAHDAHDVASTDWTLGQSLAACRARYHVSTLEQQTVDDSVHTHLADVALKRR